MNCFIWNCKFICVYYLQYGFLAHFATAFSIVAHHFVVHNSPARTYTCYWWVLKFVNKKISFSFEIFLGFVNINQCSHQRAIPITVAILGFVMNLSNFINGINTYWMVPPDSAEKLVLRRKVIGGVNLTLNCLTVICFVAGNHKVTYLPRKLIYCKFIAACICVYGSGWPSFDKSDVNYCSRFLYLFAFWFLNATFIVIGFLGILGLIGCLIVRFILKKF